MDILERCFVVSSAAMLLSLIGFALMNLHWRKFVLVQHEVAKLAQTAIDFPSMQAPASFNLQAAMREADKKINAYRCQSSAPSLNKRALSKARRHP